MTRSNQSTLWFNSSLIPFCLVKTNVLWRTELFLYKVGDNPVRRLIWLFFKGDPVISNSFLVPRGIKRHINAHWQLRLFNMQFPFFRIWNTIKDRKWKHWRQGPQTHADSWLHCEEVEWNLPVLGQRRCQMTLWCAYLPTKPRVQSAQHTPPPPSPALTYTPSLATSFGPIWTHLKEGKSWSCHLHAHQSFPLAINLPVRAASFVARTN